MAGKKMGRSLEHFCSEGTKLSNEPLENPYKEKAKQILTKYGGSKSEFKKVTASLEQYTNCIM